MFSEEAVMVHWGGSSPSTLGPCENLALDWVESERLPARAEHAACKPARRWHLWNTWE